MSVTVGGIPAQCLTCSWRETFETIDEAMAAADEHKREHPDHRVVVGEPRKTTRTRRSVFGSKLSRLLLEPSEGRPSRM